MNENWWQGRAACAGKWELFDPPADALGAGRVTEPDHMLRARLAEAIAICKTCPVFRQCKASIGKDDVGVRAGKLLHSRRQTPACPLGYTARSGNRGYDEHRERGESPCDVCFRSNGVTMIKAEALRQRQLAKPFKHGTASGYGRHLRRGEQACKPCLDARVQEERDRRSRNRERREKISETKRRQHAEVLAETDREQIMFNATGVSSLAAMRAAVGVSQRDLARLIGVAPRTVGGWEERSRIVSGPTLERYIRIYMDALGWNERMTA